MIKIITILLPTLFLIQACTNTSTPAITPNAQYSLPFNTQASLKTPKLSSTKKQLLLSWVETSRDIAQLKYATYNNKHWSQAKTVAQGNHWFVNYADYAKVEAIDEQHFIASWLEYSSENGLQYQFKIKQSFDAGMSWQDTTSPLRSQSGVNGFISSVKHKENTLFTWISQAGKTYQIHSAKLNRQNEWSAIHVVDDASCSCCHTDLALQGNEVITAYRNRTDNEIRDIAISRYKDSNWQAPEVIHPDNWKINGCPVNAPSITATKNSHSIIWYTFANNQSKVNVKTFLAGDISQFHTLDSNGLGYVDSVLINEETAIVSWLSLNSELILNLETINLTDGSLGIKTQTKIEQTSAGFPSITIFDKQLFIVNESSETGLQLQVIDLNTLK